MAGAWYVVLMEQRREPVRAALAEALGVAIDEISFTPVAGGCINETYVVDAGGARFFVKWNDRPLPRQFEAEARGLEALREAASTLVVPRPIAFADEGPGRSFLIVDFLEPGTRGCGFDERLGRGLAELHSASCPDEFGFHMDGFCGATPQPNGWRKSWVRFYAENRLGHQLALARGDGFSSSEARTIERVIERLPELIEDDEPPALIHGDLWSGNLHVTSDGQPALIDPAAYYGHREAELGMMLLFGGFGSRVLDAYDEVRPLRQGWRQRVGLYSLYHVLNHHHLFGGGYRTQALELAQRYA